MESLAHRTRRAPKIADDEQRAPELHRPKLHRGSMAGVARGWHRSGDRPRDRRGDHARWRRRAPPMSTRPSTPPPPAFAGLGRPPHRHAPTALQRARRRHRGPRRRTRRASRATTSASRSPPCPTRSSSSSTTSASSAPRPRRSTQAPGEYLAGLHVVPAARAARRRRPHRAVELPADDGGLEDRPGAGRRQHRRAEAVAS